MGLDQDPTTIHYDENGDGTVPSASFLKCDQMNPLLSRTFPNVNHEELVKDSGVIEFIVDVVNPVQVAESVTPSPIPSPSPIENTTRTPVASVDPFSYFTSSSSGSSS